MRRLLTALLLLLCSTLAQAGVFVGFGSTAPASSYWEDFDATDGVELSTLSGWSLSQDGTNPLLISTDAPVHDGTGVAEILYDISDNRSRYIKAAAQSSRYALITAHFYPPTGDGQANRMLLAVLGNAGAATITFLRVDDINTTTCRVSFLYAGGNVDVAAEIARGQWHKVELMIDTTDNDMQVSVNDGTPGTVRGSFASYGVSHIRMQNDGTSGTSLRVDSISFEDGGEL